MVSGEGTRVCVGAGVRGGCGAVAVAVGVTGKSVGVWGMPVNVGVGVLMGVSGWVGGVTIVGKASGFLIAVASGCWEGVRVLVRASACVGVGCGVVVFVGEGGVALGCDCMTLLQSWPKVVRAGGLPSLHAQPSTSPSRTL